MLSATFIGEVHQGRVDVPLEFEGKRVKVTVTVEDAPPDVRAAEEAEILEDCGRIRVPPRDVTPITIRIVDVGRRPMRDYAEDDCEIWGD
jgi:hypothetical protein